MVKLEEVRVDIWHRTIEELEGTAVRSTYRLVPDDDGASWRVWRIPSRSGPWEALGAISFDLRGRPRVVAIDGAPSGTTHLLAALAEAWKANHGDLVPGTPTLRPPFSAP